MRHPRNRVRRTMPKRAYRSRKTRSSPTRTPYGGFVSNSPVAPVGSASEIECCSNSMSSLTRARVEFSRAAWIAPASRSDPTIRTPVLGTIAASARSRSVSKVAWSKSGQDAQAKFLSMPGGMRLSRLASSIGIVPDPQKGSQNALCCSDSVAIMHAAAKFSRTGAFPLAKRYPRRWRGSPELSRLTTHRSWSSRIRIGCSRPTLTPPESSVSGSSVSPPPLLTSTRRARTPAKRSATASEW